MATYARLPLAARAAAQITIGGIKKPATIDIDFDAGVVDQVIERLTVRARSCHHADRRVMVPRCAKGGGWVADGRDRKSVV